VKLTPKAGWQFLLLPRMKLKRPIGPNDRLVLTVAVRRALVDVGVVESVKVRRSRSKKEPG
jgi:hypothetical protein